MGTDWGGWFCLGSFFGSTLASIILGWFIKRHVFPVMDEMFAECQELRAENAKLKAAADPADWWKSEAEPE